MGNNSGYFVSGDGYKADVVDKSNDAIRTSVIQGTDGVPPAYSKLTSSGQKFNIQKGALNKLRIRPQITNEQCESSRVVQSTVTSTNIVGQIFKASQDNINGIDLVLRSAEAEVFDDFESYVDSAALQAAWIATDPTELAELETTIVYEGSKSISIPAGAGVGDEWARTFTSTDFTGYVGTFHMLSTHSFTAAKIRVIVEDSAGNTNSAYAVQSAIGVWELIELNINALTADGATPADISDIVRLGFRLDDRRNNAIFYIDEMVSIPPAGSLSLKLWDMGDTLPESGVTSIDDGTQYEKLGDLGITGTQVAEIDLVLSGGFKNYHISEFVAGVALEIPTNEILNAGNYYAITLNYIDTDVDVYGTNPAFNYDYYVNGYAFTAVDEATAISQVGQYNDLMFIIYSTQDVYVELAGSAMNDVPNGNSLTTIYIEDTNMLRTTVLASNLSPFQVYEANIVNRPAYMVKGSKIEQEYNDDLSDEVSKITFAFKYYYIPPIING